MPKIKRYEVYPQGTAHSDAARAEVPAADMGEIWYFHCLGCGYGHSYRTKAAKDERRQDGSAVPVWSFNGNLERPSFQPSLLVHGHKDERGKETGRCHLFLTNGELQFCGDSQHALAGKTVPLEELD